MSTGFQAPGDAGIDQERKALANFIRSFIRGLLSHHPTVLAISVQIIPDSEDDVQTWVDAQPFVGRDKALELFSNALRDEASKK